LKNVVPKGKVNSSTTAAQMSQGSVVIHRVVVLKRVHRHEGGVQEREWQRHFFNTLVCVVKC